MNNHLKGILAGAFILLVTLLLLSKCTSCRQQPEPIAAADPEPIEIIDEPVDNPEPQPEPEPEPAPEPEPVEVRTDEGQDGEIRVTIEWPFPGDVDLHVTEPSGNEIDYRNMRNSRTGGYLDVDNRTGGTPSSTAVENVFWSNPDAGRYRVELVYYNTSPLAPDGGYVNVRVKNGAQVDTYRARLTHRGQRVLITEFVHPN